MQKNNIRPLTGCCDSRVLWMSSDDVTDVIDEASIRAAQARDLAAAMQASEALTASHGLEVLRSAMNAITTLLSDAIDLYGYAYTRQKDMPARK